MILKKAWRDLSARKLRTLLVVLSVAVGVFGVSAIKILGDQFERAAAAQFATSNPPDLTVDSTVVNTEQRAKLRELENVKTVEGRIASTARWKPKGGDRKESIAIQGVANFAQEATLDRVRIVRGKAPGAGEILFEKGSRQKFDLKIGQEVTLYSADREQKYTISGFGENPNVTSAAAVGFASAWLTRDEAEKLLQLGGTNRTLIKLTNTGTANVRTDTEKRVRESLEGNDVTVLASQVRDPSTLPGKDMLDSLRALLLVFALLGAFASGLLVANTISTIILEQRGQIGSMKAVGGTTGQVMRVYLALALLYGALGTALGLAAGIGFNFLASGLRAAALDEEPAPVTITSEAVALAVGIGIGVCLLAAIIPSWLGARCSIREAMVSYGLAARFGHSPWDRLVARLTMLPQASILAARNVFRQPNRALFTIVGLSIATALILAVLAALGSLSVRLEDARAAVKADVIVAFEALAGRDAVETALKDTSGIDRRELWIVTSAKSDGKTIAVTGLPQDTTIFNRDLIQSGGRWLKADRTDEVIITQRLAARRGLKVEDKIELQNGSHDKQTWTIVGIVPGAGADALAPDGAAYAVRAAVRALADFPEGQGTHEYIRLTEHGQAQVDSKATAISDALADAGLANTPIKLYEQDESNQRTFAVFILIFLLMILIVSVVGALGLFSTLTMNVMERRREIGVMRSVGASTGTVLWTFLMEGLLLGTLGWALGAVFGGPAGEALVTFLSDKLFAMEYVAAPESLVVTLVGILGVAFVSSIGPALAAARMPIAEILRYA